jgi:transcriptional regulator with XRE-family HTH domain
MAQPPLPNEKTLGNTIARLVRERGWNQEDFARIANISRHTVRTIFIHGDNRRLRNATVSSCARALGLTVSELRGLPLDRLLARMHGGAPDEGDDTLKRLKELATQPELIAWLERHADRARQLSAPEIYELLGMQGPTGPIAAMGVEHFVELFERKRRLRDQVEAVARSEYLPLLEQFVGLLAEKVGAK